MAITVLGSSTALMLSTEEREREREERKEAVLAAADYHIDRLVGPSAAAS